MNGALVSFVAMTMAPSYDITSVKTPAKRLDALYNIKHHRWHLHGPTIISLRLDAIGKFYSMIHWQVDFIVRFPCVLRFLILFDLFWQGRQSRLFDYSRDDDDEHEFTVAASSSNGQAVAIGSFDRVRIFTWSPRQNAWNELAAKEISKFYTVTALSWRRDGSRLVIGSLCGAVITFESALRRSILQDKFELTFVAPSQVLVKSLESSGENVLIESQLGHEIYDVRIMGKLMSTTMCSLFVSP